jgi:hypothetical protein
VAAFLNTGLVRAQDKTEGMAKQRRARNDSQLARKASGSAPAEGERATSAPVLAHARKLNKRVKFLQRARTRHARRFAPRADTGGAGVQESALAARATVFKRKRLANGATLSSLASLVRTRSRRECRACCAPVLRCLLAHTHPPQGDALPDLLAASPGGKAKPAHFLATRGPKVVRAARRTKICAAETVRANTARRTGTALTLRRTPCRRGTRRCWPTPRFKRTPSRRFATTFWRNCLSLR